MKHASLFIALFLANFSAYAACSDEPVYLAPVELQPQCHQMSEIDTSSGTEGEEIEQRSMILQPTVWLENGASPDSDGTATSTTEPK